MNQLGSQLGLPFDWAGQARAGRLIRGEANRLAVAHVERWREWPVPISILSGPAKSGKTMLGRYFAEISGGEVIDDADSRAGSGADNETDRHLFHRWNLARDSGRPLLLIAREEPGRWPVALPDLRSRLAAAPHVRIGEPDDALMRALIESGLLLAGSAYSPDLPEWLARRAERSYAAIAMILDRLNAMSLASARKISIPMAKEALHDSGFLPISEGETAPEGVQSRDRKSSDDV